MKRACEACGADLTGRHGLAKVCDWRCYRKVHRDQINANNRKCAARRYRINRDLLIEYLNEHPCVDCGEDDIIVLEFDHRDPSKKRAQVGDALGSWNWTTIMTEIEKCDVRCANCHRRKTTQDRGWFRGGGADASLDR